jgi:uncharacterized membrane protein
MAESRREARANRARMDRPREPRRFRLPRLDQETFGRWAEAIARNMGTAKFLVYMTAVIVLWIGWNTLGPTRLRFDPYTFTFLTLILSLQASYAAPLILLAQNRQADRDRLALEEDRRRAAMQKADTEYLSREIAAVRIAVGEVATRDYLRSELSRLVEELTELPVGGRDPETAQRRRKLERKEQRRIAKRQAGLKDPDTFDEPADDRAEDSDLEGRPAAGPSPRSKTERRAPQGARRATPSD